VVTVVGGLMVFAISSYVQQKYAKSQQKFLLDQGKRTHKIDAASAAEDEIVRALSKRLTGIANVLGAFRANLASQQYRESIDYYVISKREWDNNQEVLEVKVSIYFPSTEIHKQWDGLVGELDDFENTVTEINEKFGAATSPSRGMENAVAAADKDLEKATNDIRTFAQELNNFINDEESRNLSCDDPFGRDDLRIQVDSQPAAIGCSVQSVNRRWDFTRAYAQWQRYPETIKKNAVVESVQLRPTSPGIDAAASWSLSITTGLRATDAPISADSAENAASRGIRIHTTEAAFMNS
jgi:hypothetical protein